MNASSQVTQLLAAMRSGNAQAESELLILVYDQLRQMAAARMAREASGHTLQATALVHEVWTRLMANNGNDWQNRRHFFFAASESMRRVLIDYAKHKKRLKRGGPAAKRLPVQDDTYVKRPTEDEFIDLNSALEQLQLADPMKAQIVKLKFFGGLSNQEVAELLNLSLATVERYWSFARAWLHQKMKA